MIFESALVLTQDDGTPAQKAKQKLYFSVFKIYERNATRNESGQTFSSFYIHMDEILS